MKDYKNIKGREKKGEKAKKRMIMRGIEVLLGGGGGLSLKVKNGKGGGGGQAQKCMQGGGKGS